MCKYYFKFLILIVCIPFLASAHDANTMFQVAPVSALMQGVYTSTYSINELSNHGDFGIGTLDHLEGELIAYMGKFYSVDQEGNVSVARGSQTTPFAQVVFFHSQSNFTLRSQRTYNAFIESVEGQFSNKNLSYSVMVKGKFKSLKLRSLRPQKPPYKDFSTVTEEQAIHEWENIEGLAIGFYCPSYWGTLTFEGFHLHFLTSDFKKGGHILDMDLESAEVYIQEITQVNMVLPALNTFFKKANLDQAPQRGY